MKERVYIPTGEKHGLINKLPNSVQKKDMEHLNENIRAEAKKQREDDAKIVKCRYINYRGQHERLDKPYCRWPGEPILVFHLIPNETYDLPKGFIKEVNENQGLPTRSDLLDAKGVPMLKDGKPKRIHELVPASF